MNSSDTVRSLFDRCFNRSGICLLLFASSTGLQASNLWTNGAVSATYSVDTRCDSGANNCGGSATWTIFDNFNVAIGKTWAVNGFDFTDLLINGTNADYTGTNWYIFSGNPLAGGSLVGSGSVVGSITLLSGTCGNGSTCLEQFTLSLGSSIVLAGGNTYYLGTTNSLTSTFASEATFRAFAAGGNTAPGGTVNPLTSWEQSNGSTTGIIGSGWTAGSQNWTFPGPLGINETATAFDILGTTVAPEPGTVTMLISALALLVVVHKRSARRAV